MPLTYMSQEHNYNIHSKHQQIGNNDNHNNAHWKTKGRGSDTAAPPNFRVTHGHGCSELFCGMQWNNEMACINFLELLQLPMKKQGCYKVAYDEQDCNNLVTRLYNAITHLYDNKL